jgi:hypothetical protein
MSSLARRLDVLGTELWFDEHMMHVRLSDGREIAVPLKWFPKLAHASTEARNNWRSIGQGVGIHWPDLGEDLSVEQLLTGERS